MGKLRRDLPLIDFTDESNGEWIRKILLQHPEIIADGFVKPDDLSPTGIERLRMGKLQLVSMPGKPKLKNGKIDWEAWFLFYNLCVLAGFNIGYDHIAIMIDRSPITVKQKFILISKTVKINT